MFALFSELKGLGQARDLPHVGHVEFQGRYLVALSNTDMVSSAYSDGLLGPAQGVDTLSVIQLGNSPADWKASTAQTRNSVVGPPTAMALTPDGRRAIVVETLGARPSVNGTATLSDLPTSRKITVVDLSDLDNPIVVQVLEGFDQPSTVSVNADGDLVSVTHTVPPGGGGQ